MNTAAGMSGADLVSLRLDVLGQGWLPIPVTSPDFVHPKCKSSGKAPFFKGWQKLTRETITPEVVRSWQRIQGHGNTGLLCGDLLALDLDIYDSGLAKQVEALATAMLPTTNMVRIGQAPKSLRCFRNDAPRPKCETPELFLLDGSKHQVEAMGHGQQIVGFGTHPATGQQYHWLLGDPAGTAFDTLPIVTKAELDAFLRAVEAVIRAAGGRTKKEIDAETAALETADKGAEAKAKDKPHDGVKAKGESFFKQVNRAALSDLGAWVRRLFPKAEKQQTGAWRVSSADLGRDYEEDLSIHPTGVQDFGPRQGKSPCDLVMQFGGAPDVVAAAMTLCEWMGRDPASLGWTPRSKPTSPSAASLDGFDLTEDGIGLAFTKAHQDLLRYDHSIGKWFQWTGKAWRQDETRLAFSWSRGICRKLAKEADAEGKLLAILAKASTAAAVERFAQSDPALAVTSAIWDRDAFLLGTPGGTLDLRTGIVRAPIREDHITKLTAVAPSATAECPLWLDFLKQVTANDEGLIRFLQQWCGYCLTGDISEHALLFAHGPGGNGKGVFLNTVARIMGDYTKNAAMDTFVASTSDKHPTDLAMLRGARMVTASETEEGRAWAESRIKAMTGGDPITARFMRQDFFEYQPQFKLTIIGNHKPVLRNVDEAARRRFNMIPFLYRPPVKDTKLEEKLRAEWPGILRWMIEGCLDWQKDGLVRPDVVAKATAEYFGEQDIVQHWIEESCDRGDTQSGTTTMLFKSWTDYALANGEKPGTSKWFSQTLTRLGYEAVKNTPGKPGKRGFKGISVRFVKPKDKSELDLGDGANEKAATGTTDATGATGDTSATPDGEWSTRL